MILDALESRSLENPSTPLNWNALANLFSKPTKSSIHVDEHVALTHPGVWACVRVIAQTFGIFPACVKEIADGRRRRAREHWLDPIVSRRPNPEQTPQTFFETLQGHRSQWGNCYFEVERSNAGRALRYWPLNPSRTEPIRKGGVKLLLTYVRGNENASFEPRHLRPDQYVHVPGLGFDGLKGYSPIHMHREAVGAALARQQFGASVFANGAKLGAVFTTPKKLSDGSYNRLKKDLEASSSGLDNMHRIQLLEDGLSVETIGMPLNDAQMVELLDFDILDFCRIFGVPPHKVARLSEATFSNIEAQNIEFATNTMTPVVVGWEQALSGQLDDPKFEVRFDMDALHRADMKTRSEANGLAVQWGIKTRDEIREDEDRNALPDRERGGETWMPVNMWPSSTLPARVPGQTTPTRTLEAADDGHAERQAIRRHMLPVLEAAIGRTLRRFARVEERAARSEDIEAYRAQHHPAARRSAIDDLMPGYVALASAIAAAISGAEEMDARDVVAGMISARLDSILKGDTSADEATGVAKREAVAVTRHVLARAVKQYRSTIDPLSEQE